MKQTNDAQHPYESTRNKEDLLTDFLVFGQSDILVPQSRGVSIGIIDEVSEDMIPGLCSSMNLLSAPVTSLFPSGEYFVRSFQELVKLHSRYAIVVHIDQYLVDDVLNLGFDAVEHRKVTTTHETIITHSS